MLLGFLLQYMLCLSLKTEKKKVFDKEKVYLLLHQKNLFSLNLYRFWNRDPGGFGHWWTSTKKISYLIKPSTQLNLNVIRQYLIWVPDTKRLNYRHYICVCLQLKPSYIHQSRSPLKSQKQSSRGVIRKKYSENM